MFRLRYLPLVLAVAACSDSITGPGGPAAPDDDEPTLESIPGILESHRLLRSGDRLIHLFGWQTDLFKDLVGAEMLIDGVIDTSDGALMITDFMVLAVDGLPALDGELIETETGFTVHSLRLDKRLAFATVPEPLANAVGKRVWVTTRSNGSLARYGVLEM